MLHFNRYRLLDCLGKSVVSMVLLILFINTESFASTFLQEDERITPVIHLRFFEEDSIKYITAQVMDYSLESEGVPASDLDIYFFVQRTFSQLPVGGDFNFTDENGEASIEFPNDLPGDSAGNVTVIVKIDEYDMFNETEVTQVVQWGIPFKIDPRENRRSLWGASANAPISLIILVNAIILAVWGYIIYIISMIFKISKVK